MAKPKGPFIALLAIVGTALSLTAFELLRHRYAVTALDGSTVIIETDPALIEAKAGLDAGMEGMREYGGSEEASADLPSSSGREANLAGTKARDG